jgi:hypothetical protein
MTVNEMALPRRCFFVADDTRDDTAFDFLTALCSGSDAALA